MIFSLFYWKKYLNAFFPAEHQIMDKKRAGTEEAKLAEQAGDMMTCSLQSANQLRQAVIQ